MFIEFESIMLQTLLYISLLRDFNFQRHACTLGRSRISIAQLILDKNWYLILLPMASSQFFQKTQRMINVWCCTSRKSIYLNIPSDKSKDINKKYEILKW